MKQVSIFKLHGPEVLWALSLTVNGHMYAKIYLMILEIQERLDDSVRSMALNLVLKIVDVFAVRLHIADQLGYQVNVPLFWNGGVE